jgi:hypothetical protein
VDAGTKAGHDGNARFAMDENARLVMDENARPATDHRKGLSILLRDAEIDELA